MANIDITNYTTVSPIRGVEHSEQGIITLAEGVTIFPVCVLGRITATEKYAPYNPDASDGSEKPVAVSLSEVCATSAGDYHVGVMLAGEVDEAYLYVAGTDQKVSAALKDALRGFGIYAKKYTETAVLDNQ